MPEMRATPICPECGSRHIRVIISTAPHRPHGPQWKCVCHECPAESEAQPSIDEALDLWRPVQNDGTRIGLLEERVAFLHKTVVDSLKALDGFRRELDSLKK